MNRLVWLALAIVLAFLCVRSLEPEPDYYNATVVEVKPYDGNGWMPLIVKADSREQLIDSAFEKGRVQTEGKTVEVKVSLKMAEDAKPGRKIRVYSDSSGLWAKEWID
jgi:hypothetical protein